ncbi:hypothetical protein QAD02_006107 [Eretmocerus hayati]|uniref:Uncharacterized protein n=1 Tax=Eretmocerus hayati TaxID=131215 RepID=A0ACC2N025_9HYME|nr:hypothetical protein QAD02_006107 [Eretmocerus hayati]
MYIQDMEAIWRTDLDWVMVHRERLVVLSFMNIPEHLNLSLYQPPSHSTSQPYLDELEEAINASSSSQEYNTWPVPQTTGSSTATHLSPSSAPANLISTEEDSTGVDWHDRNSESESLNPTSTDLPDLSTTTTTTTTRRPTSRMNARNAQRNRPKSKKNSAIARPRPTPQQQQPKTNWTAQSLPLSLNSLSDLDRPENLNVELDETSDSYGPITLEYLNYAMALGVYSVRYPAVFWATNKALGTIFSFQLVANTLQCLLAYAGMSVLYKVQVVGPLKVLPLLRHRTITTTSTISNFLGDRFFLLNPHVTLGLFALSTLLVLCSSMVMYLYAYGRYASFLRHERERRVILSKDARVSEESASWTYMTHPAALCVWLAIGICSAPLVYDYTVVYRGSLDGAVLACIAFTILHLGLWLLLWVCLSLKRHWTFKLRVTIARATVRSARSLKLVTDVDLANSKTHDDDEDAGSHAPLLVVGNGRTYTVPETSPKKAIMSVIQKAAMDRKARSQSGAVDSVDGDSTADGEEQIYWLRPKLRPSPVQSGGSGSGASCQSNEKGWLNKKLKQKVTFNDLPSTSGARNKGKARRADGGPEDDGDYATLRELPLVTTHELADDTTSEEKLLECVNDDQVTYYASGNRDLQPSEGEPSPMLCSPSPLPDPPQLQPELPLPLPPPIPISDQDPSLLVCAVNTQISSGTTPQTPRCLRRADSGMAHDELTPRSDSSHSPPLDSIGTNGCGSNSLGSSSNGVSMSCTNGNMNGTNGSCSTSEASSSGVHSASSSQRRANSVEDLTNEPREEPHWRSCSLQRGTQPPGSLVGSAPKFSNPGRVITNPGASYAPSTQLYNGFTDVSQVQQQQMQPVQQQVVLENEATVVIRRKNSRSKLTELGGIGEEPFGRSTNMRMTSFTENSDVRPMHPVSATLPHYPTQPVVTYPHCSTMPLPHASNHNVVVGPLVTNGSGSCGSVPRHPGNIMVPSQQQQQPQPVAHGVLPSHTTLPQHHNGVRLMMQPGNPGSPNPYVKRFPVTAVAASHQQWNAVLPGAVGPVVNGTHQLHHTFPQAPLVNGKLVPQHHQQQMPRHSDRDSANFSMASSGDSDTCLPH